MASAWKNRAAKVKQWEQVNKEQGRLPYWNDRARTLNNRVKKVYGIETTITGQQLKDLYELSNGQCLWCREILKPFQACIDHMKPLKLGGAHDIENLSIICPECNTSKGDDDPDTFLERVEETRIPEKLYNRLYARK